MKWRLFQFGINICIKFLHPLKLEIDLHHKVTASKIIRLLTIMTYELYLFVSKI